MSVLAKSKYTEKDAARDTGAGGKDTARAWHQAREDARESGEIPKKDTEKESGKKNK